MYTRKMIKNYAKDEGYYEKWKNCPKPCVHIGKSICLKRYLVFLIKDVTLYYEKCNIWNICNTLINNFRIYYNFPNAYTVL